MTKKRTLTQFKEFQEFFTTQIKKLDTLQKLERSMILILLANLLLPETGRGMSQGGNYREI